VWSFFYVNSFTPRAKPTELLFSFPATPSIIFRSGTVCIQFYTVYERVCCPGYHFETTIHDPIHSEEGWWVWLKNYVREYSYSVHMIGRELLLDTYVGAWDPTQTHLVQYPIFQWKKRRGMIDSVRYLHYTIQGKTRQDKRRHSRDTVRPPLFLLSLIVGMASPYSELCTHIPSGE